ncbi:NAD(P)H-dependent glycerol-3-phosphate dehydrogenase [Aquamicrobium sp. LC103]|uniref:NAD(P)H-dependent glycerol-3-phosphate dehydrogenase n=1 Tax=Aquamicrobium sp. LC103 TaxID=1120658 RepID=UPI00063EC251|nr:NAD(P)H-dependent glycerol-3-phosphate dehydrogenase [Aquamicrobium sp. LC103]TKT82928.1 NAD(P)-dependent glycerol-3-phosphate dehydrogenase [Aquamicrobium sp. LC103]
MTAKRKIAVLGGGAWGTALAATMRRAGREATIWARDEATVTAINTRRENPRYLPGITLDEGFSATGDMDEALGRADCVLAVVPAQTMRELFTALDGRLAPGTPLVLCAKGIERATGKLLSEIAAEMLPRALIAALSGPSFATDVVRGLPTAVTVACEDHARAAELAGLLTAPHFRCYSTTDLVGVEIGGALKNVLAIAAGAVSGAGLGASAQAALVTRGFVELRRVGMAFGAEPETLMGLSGLGDLVLTCGSAQSRNFAYGVALGRGESLVGRPLAEGVATAGIAAAIARERGIEAPIIEAVDDILSGRTTIAGAVAALMSRPLKSETANEATKTEKRG